MKRDHPPAARPRWRARAWAASLVLHALMGGALVASGLRPEPLAALRPVEASFVEVPEAESAATIDLVATERLLEPLPTPDLPEATHTPDALPPEPPADLVAEVLPDVLPDVTLPALPADPMILAAPSEAPRVLIRQRASLLSSDLPPAPALPARPQPLAAAPAPLPAVSRPAPRVPPSVAFAPSPTNYYPEPARRDGSSGDVLVEVLIAAAGHVHDARILRGSGDARLDAAALRLAADYRFHPPGAWARGRLTIRFRLH